VQSIPGRATGWLAVAASAPTVVWRAVVGLGFPLGTPDSWRTFQHIPGSGTVYVLSLSLFQAVAAALTLRLASPDGDRIPFTRRRVPRRAVAAIAFAGAALLVAVCVFSVLAWNKVDPFAGQPHDGWALLCLACYLCALLWPVFLVLTTVSYLRRTRPH